MAITLGQLRTFCEEQASPDSSGGTADREFMKWINGALTRLYRASPWDRLVREEKRIIVPQEAVTAVLGLTQGSLNISRSSGTFLQKYVDDRWELAIDGYTRGTFELASIGTPATTAVMRAGDEWPGDTTLVGTGNFLFTRLPLPLAKNVTRVQLVETGLGITILTPRQFDRQKDVSPGSRGSDPRFCTFRRGRLEFWPHPGDNYRKLSITYHLAYTQMADSDDDDTEVEWDETQIELLQKAILLEASVLQGDAAVVPYPVALREYQEALRGDKEFSQRHDLTGPMGLNLPDVNLARRRRGYAYDAEVEDVP